MRVIVKRGYDHYLLPDGVDLPAVFAFLSSVVQVERNYADGKSGYAPRKTTDHELVFTLVDDGVICDAVEPGAEAAT